jgi:5-oxoprolinase (ATP-hydrolysing) subunit A
MTAAKDEEISRAIIEAIQKVDPDLVIYCMRASTTYEVARKMDQPVATEFFADRDYSDEGQIVFTRKVTEELDPEGVAERVVRGITESKVETVNGNDIDIPSDSVCVHSDTPGAVELAKAIVQKLGENDVEIRPLGRAKQRVS